MSHDVLETSANGNYRVRLEYDMYAETPYDDGMTPILRIERYGSPEHVGMSSRPHDLDSAVEAAVERWGSPNGHQWFKVERFLRAFLGATTVQTWYSGDNWYVAYDTTAWREYVGTTAAGEEFGDLMSEWKAYVNGEVYGYVVEKRQTVETIRRLVTDAGDDSEEISRETADEWELVDACSGFYGYEYAAEAAREALALEAS